MSRSIPASLSSLESKHSRSWVLNEPFAQPFYRFEKNGRRWVPVPVQVQQVQQVHDNDTAVAASASSLPSKFRLITWNIDAQVPHAEERMAGALTHLEKLYRQTTSTTTTADTPVVIFLQEMLPSDLQQIKQAGWVREHFHVTDLTPEFWESPYYGTTTLVDKRLVVQRVFRVHYCDTRMQRDGLFVDVLVGADTQGTASGAGVEPLLLRLCNTHLESLVSNPPLRPKQMKLASAFMHGSGSVNGLPPPHAAALAGDLNAFAPEDRTAPIECGLQDAFLVLGGRDDTDEAYTWGQQVPEELRRRFGCSRMDKVLFCGGLRVTGLERIGEGVKVKARGEEVWVTDHLGLMADFTVT